MAFKPGLARFRGTALGDQGAGFLIPAALLHQRILAAEQDNQGRCASLRDGASATL